MTIALLVNGIFPFEIGGIQKHSYFFARYLAQKKIHVDIFQTKRINKDSLENYFEDNELKYLNFIFVKFPQFPAFPGHYIWNSYFFSKRLFRKVVKGKKYDVIYAQGLTSWFFLGKKDFNNNLITNLHGLEMFQSSISLKQRIGQVMLNIPAKKIIKKSNRQVSLGGKLTNILYEVGAKPNSVVEIPNAIPSNWIVNENEIEISGKDEEIHFVFIGRYERRKGIEELQQVILRTTDKLKYHVSFIGPIPQDEQIHNPRVKYLGLVKDSEKIKIKLKQADILICPSYSEGMPTVILEAMACGCAIIATDVGATREVVNNEVGWLIEGDICSGLENAILKAVKISKDKLRQKKINALQKVSEKFTWDQVVNQTINEIEKCKDS